MSDDKGELKHFADGFHEGEWERDVEVPRPWPGLDQILKDMDIPDEWKSVKTMTWDEFTKKYGSIKTEITKSGKTTYTPEWIYESPDGGKTIYNGGTLSIGYITIGILIMIGIISFFYINKHLP